MTNKKSKIKDEISNDIAHSMEFKELKLIEVIANNWSIFVDLHPNNKGGLVSNDIVKEIYDCWSRDGMSMGWVLLFIPMPTLKLGFDENIANLRSFLVMI